MATIRQGSAVVCQEYQGKEVNCLIHCDLASDFEDFATNPPTIERLAEHYLLSPDVVLHSLTAYWEHGGNGHTLNWLYRKLFPNGDITDMGLRYHAVLNRARGLEPDEQTTWLERMSWYTDEPIPTRAPWEHEYLDWVFDYDGRFTLPLSRSYLELGKTTGAQRQDWRHLKAESNAQREQELRPYLDSLKASVEYLRDSNLRYRTAFAGLISEMALLTPMERIFDLMIENPPDGEAPTAEFGSVFEEGRDHLRNLIWESSRALQQYTQVNNWQDNLEIVIGKLDGSPLWRREIQLLLDTLENRETYDGRFVAELLYWLDEAYAAVHQSPNLKGKILDNYRSTHVDPFIDHLSRLAVPWADAGPTESKLVAEMRASPPPPPEGVSTGSIAESLIGFAALTVSRAPGPDSLVMSLLTVYAELRRIHEASSRGATAVKAAAGVARGLLVASGYGRTWDLSKASMKHWVKLFEDQKMTKTAKTLQRIGRFGPALAHFGSAFSVINTVFAISKLSESWDGSYESWVRAVGATSDGLAGAAGVALIFESMGPAWLKTRIGTAGWVRAGGNACGTIGAVIGSVALNIAAAKLYEKDADTDAFWTSTAAAGCSLSALGMVLFATGVGAAPGAVIMAFGAAVQIVAAATGLWRSLTQEGTYKVVRAYLDQFARNGSLFRKASGYDTSDRMVASYDSLDRFLNRFSDTFYELPLVCAPALYDMGIQNLETLGALVDERPFFVKVELAKERRIGG